MSSVSEPNHPQRFFRDFIRLSGPYWTGRTRWRPRLLTMTLALLVIAQVAIAIRLNIWSADLFDALERRATDHALTQIGVFVLIMFGTMAGNTAHVVVRRHLQLDWRRWLTARVIGAWIRMRGTIRPTLFPATTPIRTGGSPRTSASRRKSPSIWPAPCSTAFSC